MSDNVERHVQGVVTFHRTFSAAHRLMNHKGKCRNIHGHNYRVSVTITGPINPETGMVVEFDRVKEPIDVFDHALILQDGDDIISVVGETGGINVVYTAEAPTTENLANVIAERVYRAACVENGGMESEGYVNVTLFETDNIIANACWPNIQLMDQGEMFVDMMGGSPVLHVPSQ